MYFGLNQALEDAIVALPQAGFFGQHMMLRIGDQLRRVLRSSQIRTVQGRAAVHGMNPRRQGLRLVDALLGQGAVYLSLVDATGVEFGLPVAHQ